MKLTPILLRGALIGASLFFGASCASTNTPTGQVIGAGLQARATSQAMGATSAPQRTGMQDFFARGGAQ